MVALVLNLRRPQYANLAFTTGELVLGLGLLLFGWFGALIVSRRPGHPIGWLLCAFGIVAGLTDFATEYAIYGLLTRPGAVPAAGAAAWLASWIFATELALLAGLLVLFPSGRPPSPPWRGVLWLAGLGGGLAVVGALALWPLRGIALLQLRTPDPAGALGMLCTTSASGPRWRRCSALLSPWSCAFVVPEVRSTSKSSGSSTPF